MAHLQVTAVVVTYNRLAKLQDTLMRLCETAPEHLRHILVFDNASTDATADWIATLTDPRVKVVRSDINLGGAGGFETAMRTAVQELDPDWIVLMDDDARPMPDALSRFHAVPRATHDAWAAAVYYPNGTICDMNRPWVNPFGTFAVFTKTVWKRRNGFHLNADAYAGGQRDIDGGSFVGLFLSRAAIELAGYPDGRLFLYGDDVLYTLGLSGRGGRVAFDPTLRFEHDCETLNPDATLTPMWKVYYYHRNQVLVYRAAAGRLMFRPVLALRHQQWRKRAKAYGTEAHRYTKLLDLAVSDGLAAKLDRPHAEIMALSGATK